MVLIALLYAAAARAFLFEIKFEDVRAKLAEKHKLFDIFLSCAFCNGFWTGLFTYFILLWNPMTLADLISTDMVEALYFAVTVGVIGWLQRMHTSPWNN